MTNPSFNPDDPRLTAFVLGEFDDVDRDAVEQLLESSPEARAFVDDLQDTIGVLRDELSGEPAPALTDAQRTALQRAAEATSNTGSIDAEPAIATRRAVATGTHSRRGLLVGTAAAIAALVVVLAVLPQFGDQRLSDTLATRSPVASQLSGGEPIVAMTSPGKNEFADADQDAAQSAVRELSRVESMTRPADSATAGDAQSSVARRNRSTLPVHNSEVPSTEALTAEAGKVSLQLAPSESAGHKPFAKITVTVEDQPASGSKSDRSGPVPAGMVARSGATSQAAPDALPADAAGSGRAASDEGRAEKELSGASYGKASPTAPAQVTQLNSGSVTKARRLIDLESSVSSGAAGNSAGKPISEAALGVSSGSAIPRFSGEARSVSGPATMPPQPIAARGLSSQSLVSKAADQAPASPVDGLATTVTGDALKESELNEVLGFRRVPMLRVPVVSPLLQGGRGLAADLGSEAYEPIVENEFVVPDPKDPEKRLSTISVDVDTASYANMRRFLMQDQLPPPNAVRIEELVNYFKYDYPQPKSDAPFSVTTEIMLCPWQPGHRLARIGLQAKTIDKSQRPPTNLVFLLDVSGSMRPANKLPLVQQAMRLLVEEMTEDDQIAIVTYASNAGLRLVSTPGSKKPEILQSIDSLTAGGSTNGEGGIKLAYDTAIRHYIQDGANRVILCTDGDFNVGVSNDNELVELIQEKAASGVFLSVFGFGMGNLKDGKLEKLADKGNGQYGYIDNLQEARRAFSEDLAGTLYTVAKDVKLQAEFNPATVGAYRLIGYENRKLAAADFTDDTKDAGEIGAGHTVTALYEIIPRQVLVDRLNSDEFRYTGTFDVPAEAPKVDGFSDELFFVRVRYKQPDQETSDEVPADFPVNDIVITGKPVATPSADFRFAAAVASFGMNLRSSQYRGNWDLRHVYNVAVQTRGSDTDGRRAEFVDLVQRTMRIVGQQVGIDLEKLPISERPAELSAAEARIKAAVDGKYRRLLKKIEVRDDLQQYGEFSDFGFWDKSTEYKGHSDLLPGYWVYVYPNWYIWAEADETRVSAAEAKPGEASATSNSTGKTGAESPEKQ